MYDEAGAFRGKKVVVIGAGSGIGAATGILAASRGAEVVLAGRTRKHLDDVQSQIGSGARASVVDISDRESVKELFDGVGAFDHLVVTAADISYAPFLTISFDALDRIVASKLWGYAYAARFAAPKMRDGGSITLLSGLAYNRPGGDTAMISAVNGAIVSLVKALAIELAPIRVNAVSPGVTRTEGWSFMGEEKKKEFFAAVVESLPLKRVGEAEDQAEALLFAMSNRFMTGAVIEINGGGHLV